MKKITRRKFIGQAGCAAMTSATALNTLLNLKALNAAALSDSDVIGSDDYKALVCISLDGGNDGYNMLIPRNSSEYSHYAQVRREIAVSLPEILGLNDANANGRSFGLHPSMPRITNLFNEGKAAFFANVGTLIEPMSVNQFWDQSKKAPLGLLSHSDQLQQWMTAIPHERAGLGWGGKIADMINQMNDNPELSMNISMGGTNIFQTGNQSTEYAVDPVPFFDDEGNRNSAVRDIYGYNDDWLFNSTKKKAIDDLLNRTYSDIYEQTYANITRNARDGWLTYREALNNININTEFTPQYDEDAHRSLTYGLGWVAKMIAARKELGFKRQTFYVSFPGWDHHDEVVNAQSRMLGELDYAMNQFQLAMEELGTENCVVSFLISDFARTLRSNGNGTDHAWGSHVLSMGGPVKGGRLYGEFPETLIPDQNEMDLGGGIILPTTSADVYFAELAHWFGVSKSNLETIFPNLINFYDYRTQSDNPLNFLTIP